MGQDGSEIGLGGEEEVVVDGARALGPEPDLRRRLLAGDVEGATAGTCPAGGQLEQQRRLADTGLPGEQQHPTRHHAAAEHPVELADTGRHGARAVDRRPG